MASVTAPDCADRLASTPFLSEFFIRLFLTSTTRSSMTRALVVSWEVSASLDALSWISTTNSFMSAGSALRSARPATVRRPTIDTMCSSVNPPRSRSLHASSTSNIRSALMALERYRQPSSLTRLEQARLSFPLSDASSCRPSMDKNVATTSDDSVSPARDATAAAAVMANRSDARGPSVDPLMSSFDSDVDTYDLPSFRYIVARSPTIPSRFDSVIRLISPRTFRSTAADSPCAFVC